MYYFAYGSNIDTNHFLKFISKEHVKIIGPAYINNHILKYRKIKSSRLRSGVANIEESGNLKSIDFYTTTASRYYAPVAVGIWCANWELGCESLGIHGHFSVRTEEERRTNNEKARPQLPKYDVSWVLDHEV